MNPMMPNPNVTMTTSQIRLFVRFAQSRVDNTLAKMIRMPPIVGVPLLAMWEFGPSSRMGCPTLRVSSFRINHGPSTKQMKRAVIAA
jgi:hypothetical protein